MTAPHEPNFDGLSLSGVLRVNTRSDEYESAWRTGKRPDAAKFLQRVVESERDVLRDCLAQIDAEYERVTIDEFTRRLTVERVRTEECELPTAASAADLADTLVRDGTLTPFQASVLLDLHPRPLALDDYLVLDKIAAGGMGTVYKAVHRRMNRVVALKVFSTHGGDAARRARWFRREVDAAGRLSHPNIASAYDAGEDRGHAYLVSEFVDGSDLQKWVATNGPMPVSEAVRAVLDAACGLAHAHDSGVIHRDVKPSNLIRDHDGVVRVIDVGLARPVQPRPGEADSALNAIVGTPAFMAPEQVSKPSTVDAQSDVYSLGCTLYFLLTGRQVYPEISMADWLTGIVSRDPPSVRAARRDVPAALDRLFRRMIAFEKADRPGSMAEVIAGLETITRPRSWAHLRRTAAGVAGCVLAVGALVALAWPDPDKTPQPIRSPLPAFATVPFDGASSQAEWAAALNRPIEIEPIPGFSARLLPPMRPAGNDTLVPAIYIGVTEVTVGQFREFVTDHSPEYVTTAERADGVGYCLEPDGTWQVVPGCDWRSAGEQPLTDVHPVCNLGRDDCADYCRWLTGRCDGRYECRLPTEDEWEFACRAGSAGRWCCGSDRTELGRYAWYQGNVDDSDGRFRPVATKSANAFGLFDMHGNLEEWCDASPPGTGSVLRGGHIRSSAAQVESVARSDASPDAPRGGFRVVFEPK